MEHDNLFNKKLLSKKLKNYDISQISNLEQSQKIIAGWKKSIGSSDLEKTREKSLQANFLIRIFSDILGYKVLGDNEEYNLIPEKTANFGGTAPDGALGFFSAGSKDVRAVIELKDATTNLDKKQNRENYRTPVDQAFSYAPKNGPKCVWVIVSNFKEIRLYRSDNMQEYQLFNITELDDLEKFKEFYYLFAKDQLLAKGMQSEVDKLYVEKANATKEISEQFYKDYSELRDKLFMSLEKNNQGENRLFLFKKAQKILDRFVFICFCEDKDLLPKYTFSNVVKYAKETFSTNPCKVWSELEGLFLSIDKGNPPMSINKFNGGLFSYDPELNRLIIPDDVLMEFTKLSDCDFDSDLNVNILGHIFEQSIADIEKIKAEINEGKAAAYTGKRKKDGIYYTPDYVTKYIVKNTIGRWMKNAKEEIKHNLIKDGGYRVSTGITKQGKNKDYATITTWYDEIPEVETVNMKSRKAIIKMHINFWEDYEQKLRKLRVLDPACGSGAFLNAAFQYIAQEIHYVKETLVSLRGGVGLWDIDKEILENNLYGVDINAESVEITKLSLWLQTANKGKTLATLDHAIKTGNSLIRDSDIAGELAFEWEKEFAEVMQNGGFDIVIGNPPYGAELNDDEKKYILQNYETTEYNYDTYKSFIELGIKLLKNNGYCGYITPNTWFVLEKGATKLRHFLFDHYTLLNIVEMFNVFPDAVVEPTITIIQKQEPLLNRNIEVI